jgi:hypothetical protein
LVYEDIKGFIEALGIIPTSQHGFQDKKSVTSLKKYCKLPMSIQNTSDPQIFCKQLDNYDLSTMLE